MKTLLKNAWLLDEAYDYQQLDLMVEDDKIAAIGSDLGLMMRAAQSAIGALRTRDTEHVHTLAGGTQATAGY